MIKLGRVDNTEVSEVYLSTLPNQSLLYCKTKHHVRLSIMRDINIDTHHIKLIFIPSQIANDYSLVN